MKENAKKELEGLFERIPELTPCREAIYQTAEILIKSYRNGGKLLIAGNGGSAADSDHIVGELGKGFCLKRELTDAQKEALGKAYGEEGDYLASHLQQALPAISLPSLSALLTAVSNDNAGDVYFAQEVLALGKKGDVFLGISTSGNSKNVVYAMEVAKTLGMKTIALTGNRESRLSRLADATIRVDQTETYRVQERHLPVYHALCLAVEQEFFGK